MIALYATWLFVERLSSGEPSDRSFREWLEHLAQALLGL